MQSMNKMADASHVTFSAADNHNSFLPLQSSYREAALGKTRLVFGPSITGNNHKGGWKRWFYFLLFNLTELLVQDAKSWDRPVGQLIPT